MKKSVLGVLAYVCALVLCFGLFGCASGAASSGSGSNSSPSAATSSEANSTTATSSASSEGVPQSTALAPGTYIAKVETDSSMFHVNETMDGTGELTVTDEGMSVHLVLNSKKITNLYAGTVAEAQEDPAGIIEPTTDKVTYSDGMEEEVYGFDVPVPVLGEPFDVAILGSKGNWYDHKVTVSDPVSK